MYIDEAPADESLLIIEFWVKISINSLKSVVIRLFSCGLSNFIISFKFSLINVGNFINIFIMLVFAQNMVLKIHSFN